MMIGVCVGGVSPIDGCNRVGVGSGASSPASTGCGDGATGVTDGGGSLTVTDNAEAQRVKLPHISTTHTRDSQVERDNVIHLYQKRL